MKWTAALVLACAASAAELPSTGEMIAAKNWFFERAVHPQTHLIYSRVNLDDPDRWTKAVWPAPAQVRDKTNNDSEVPNFSNCAIAGGLFLGQLTDIHAVAADGECARQARIVFDGLKSLAAASPRKGFIARGLMPGDDTHAHFQNSSVDQYTFYVYGLYKYFHSPLAGEEEKREIRRIMGEICTMIERDGTILGSNGAPGWVSDIEAVRSDRSSRLLEMYMVGWAVTGDEHWRKAYLRAATQMRLRSILDPMQLRFTYVPRDFKYGDEHADIATIWQTQYSLVPLFELETDLRLKSAYLEAMRTCAAIVRRYGGKGFELQIRMLAENRGVVAPVAVEPGEWPGLTAGLIARTPRHAVEMPRGDRLAASMTHCGVTYLGAAELYWTGLRRGVLRAAPR